MITTYTLLQIVMKKEMNGLRHLESVSVKFIINLSF